MLHSQYAFGKTFHRRPQKIYKFMITFMDISGYFTLTLHKAKHKHIKTLFSEMLQYVKMQSQQVPIRYYL